MNHSSQLIAALENEVERYEKEWRTSKVFHQELFERYLSLQNVLFSTGRKFRAVPSFHRLRNFESVIRAHNASANIASGSGALKKTTTVTENQQSAVQEFNRVEDFLSDTIQLRHSGFRHVKMFGLTSRQFEMNFRHIDKVSNVIEHIEGCFNEAIDHFRRNGVISSEDQVGVALDYPGLKLGEPILVKFRQAIEIDGWTIMRAIARVLQSNQSINMAHPTSITFTHLQTPSGGGRTKVALQYMTDPDKCEGKYNKGNGHLLILKKGDQLCLPKCILIAQAKKGGKVYRRRRRYRNERKGKFVDEAKALLLRAGIGHNGPCSLYDVRLLQAVIPQCILIFDRERAHACVWDGHRNAKKLDNRKLIIIQLNNGHFDLINSLPAFFGTGSFCFDCMRTFYKFHKCIAKCTFCLKRSLATCLPDGTSTTCRQCNRKFKSLTCLENHILVLGEKKSACEMIQRCTECGYRTTPKDNHECGTHFCGVCKKRVKTIGHVCYIQKFSPSKPMKGNVGKEIFFDFESSFTTGELGKDAHKPIFACAQVQCEQCTGSWSNSEQCAICDEPPEQIFSGPDTVAEFCEWLFSDTHKHAIAIAHNLKNYDGQFITDWLSTVPNVEFKMTPRGLSILSLKCNYVRLICSTNYLAFPLRKLPAMFKFEHEVIKGEFPYKLLTDVGEISNDPIQWPAIELYDPDSRSPDDREKLIAWYETVKHRQFYPLDEVSTYCRMDVTILRKSMSMFRDMFREVSNIHPYAKAFTIASACLQSFTMNNMPEDSLLVYKESGPRKTSKKCIEWLSLREHYDGVRIRSSQSTGGEYTLVCGSRSFHADGVVQDDDGGVVSMYPSVQMQEAYPVGAYTVIQNTSVDMMKNEDGSFFVPWFGLIQVKLLATKRLIHSPVPYRTSGPDKKLVFPLCAMCAIAKCNVCEHTVEERSWWTTLCSVELELAFEHGFIALDIGEVWHFEQQMQFDPKKKGSGLFSDYMTSWLTKKVEASGYPGSCITVEDKQNFIEEYRIQQNIILEDSNMKFNAPMRATAKLALNNNWGKLCQKNNQSMYTYFKKHQLSSFYQLALDPNEEKSSIFPVGEECVCVIHKHDEESGEPCKNQSVVIGVFVTAYSRRKLFNMMHSLGEQVIYTDTDSVIYSLNPHGYVPKLSSFLGGWESELSAGEFVDSFVVCAPKSYSLRVKGPTGHRYITKSKGFTLDYQTSQLLNHYSMKKLVEEYIETGDQRTITTWRHAISKNKQRAVYSEHLSRRFRVVNSKRTFNNSAVCRPFGYDNKTLTQ